MIEPTSGRPPLDERTVDRDPFVQFGRWYEEAATVVRMPEAMALATADAAGRPSARMVLLKAWGPQGFTFYTNYESRKGGDLAANPRGALLFHWDPLGRQVRLEGPVVQLSPSESDAYFATRPPGSRVSARASRQSRPVDDRAALEAQADAVRREFGDDVPRPEWWGGYRLVPETFEFWEHRADRLHDRVAYRREDGGWRIVRLQP
ncbi:MAG TPA: pyridoxamine 5'-phosphate oxidase [Acidimicrobiales bacterium]|nr:pyridoxamine 5'-phosphate oxidase [Acidimicrobiales bacterium]